ncbi:MAG: hypothetical protein PHX10_06950, partial [Gallionellaceae bacterium]|nr:hypothetical protein [Gallionellaceae bacterium]
MFTVVGDCHAGTVNGPAFRVGDVAVIPAVPCPAHVPEYFQAGQEPAFLFARIREAFLVRQVDQADRNARTALLPPNA